jgi:RNA-dependent RNA polymerase
MFVEDYRKLQSTGPDMRKLYSRIKAILINGIDICDRQYDFLAFSSSQLREHCCWMFSSMKGVSTNHIRHWMGDFTNIHPVAKMAARVSIIQFYYESIRQLSFSFSWVNHFQQLKKVSNFNVVNMKKYPM